MKKKFPWLKYDMKKAEYMEAKEREKEAEKKLDEAVQTLKNFKGPIEYGVQLLILIYISILEILAVQ